MAGLELRPFSDEHLAAAGALLAERHRRHRLAEPALPERFDPEEEVAAAWHRDDASGAVALRDGELVGYLVGAPRDASWGENVWVEVAGQAVAESEIVRDLYGEAAVRWVDEGRTRHYAIAPNDSELLDAWARLSFGRQHAFGISEVRAEPWPDGVRLAEPRDVDALLALAPKLGGHQARSPVFSDMREEDADELRAELEQEIASAEIGSLVAEVGGRVVGNFGVVPVERSSAHAGLARPPGACLLSFAITDPEVRGSGTGLALTSACFAWAHEAGYATMVTDWRVTNLLSSRFWPARGFRTTFVRLYRSIP